MPQEIPPIHPLLDLKGFEQYRRRSGFDIVQQEHPAEWSIYDAASREKLGRVDLKDLDAGIVYRPSGRLKQLPAGHEPPRPLYVPDVKSLVAPGAQARYFTKYGSNGIPGFASLWDAANAVWYSTRPIKARQWRILSWVIHFVEGLVTWFKAALIVLAIALAATSICDVWEVKDALVEKLLTDWLAAP